LIFAKKTLNGEEFNLYSRLFSIIENALPKPDLLVYLYLDISRLQSNIRLRGRVYEQKIEDDYLQRIQEGYLDYIRQQQGLRVLLIDTNKLDFVANQQDYEILTGIILKEYPIGIHRITP
jgi:deoxyadenosine/deoxycytidine kinase